MRREMFRLAAVILAVVVTGTTRSSAQVADSLNVDLKIAIEIALSESPTVQVAGREIKRKEYYTKEQKASLLPNLSAAASYNRVIQKQVMAMEMNGQMNRIEVGTSNSWTGGLNLSLPLVAPALWKSIKLSEADIDLAVEKSRDSKISTIASVKESYYSLLMAQDSYDVLLVSYHNAELNAKIATDKYNQGLVSEFDKLRADVQLLNQRPLLVESENGVRLAKMQLKVIMGLDPAAPIRFIGKLTDFEKDMTANLDYLMGDTTLTNSSSMRQVDIQLRQLEISRKLNKASSLPTLSLSGNYQWNSLNNDFRIGSYYWTPYLAVGLNLSVPIFEGRAKHYRDKQNEIGIGNLKLQRTELSRNLGVGVRNAINNIEQSIEQVGSNRLSVTQAEKAFMISRKRYEVGSGTILELNDSEVSLTRARLSFNQSIYSYLSARAELESILGNNFEKEYPGTK